MKNLIIYSLIFFSGWIIANFFSKNLEQDEQQTKYIDLPEDISEASVGDPLFISAAGVDTIRISFDPMKDRLFNVQNPGCQHYKCKAKLIWVDLKNLVIYIEDGHAEMVDFEDEIHMMENLVYILHELRAGKKFNKDTGKFK